jgi:hypothetical protein
MPTSAIPVIDVSQLDRRALGDESLRIELLALFATEVDRLLRQVEAAPSAQVRSDRLLAVIALSRSVGAVRLAESARLLQSQGAGDAADLEPLRAAVAETLAFLGRFSA